MPGRKAFRNKEQNIKELISLRLKGYTITDIARKYKVDHSSIIYHLQKAGVALKKNVRDELLRLAIRGYSLGAITKSLGIPSPVVEYYCVHHGIQIVPKKKKVILPPLVPKLPGWGTKRKSPLVVGGIDARGVEWRTDELGNRICLGRSDQRRKIDSVKEAEKALKRRRLDMLKY